MDSELQQSCKNFFPLSKMIPPIDPMSWVSAEKAAAACSYTLHNLLARTQETAWARQAAAADCLHNITQARAWAGVRMVVRGGVASLQEASLQGVEHLAQLLCAQVAQVAVEANLTPAR